MRIAAKLLTSILGGVFLAGMGQPASAGCVGGVTGGCNPGVVVHPGVAAMPAPVDVYSSNPYGYLQQFEYKGTPDVNITRIYGQRPTVALSDHPSQFTNGCQPSSTVYCRAPQAQPAPVAQPVIAPPMPVIAPRPSVNLAPRQYGSTELVRGIAHVPTSIVDRSAITHIDGVPQPRISSVTTAQSATTTVTQSVRPQSPAPQGRVLGYVNAGSYTYQPPGGGRYWEKTSGPTMVDGLPATQILCRRETPRPAPVTVNVVRPVIGVPQPVPTPVPVQAQPQPQPQCAPVPMGPVAPAPYAGGPQVPMLGPMYSDRFGSRWEY